MDITILIAFGLTVTNENKELGKVSENKLKGKGLLTLGRPMVTNGKVPVDGEVVLPKNVAQGEVQVRWQPKVQSDIK